MVAKISKPAKSRHWDSLPPSHLLPASDSFHLLLLFAAFAGNAGARRPTQFASRTLFASMSLSERLHVERTEFLIADQSKDAQNLMIDYLATFSDRPSGER
jgi:hypothetical protein